MADQEREWLDRMEVALNTAREWEKWAENLHLPQKRSALHYDDQLCEAFPTSSSAYHGISAAIDHINFIGDAVMGRQATRPYAYFPPARAATFAAARSVWILSPPYRKERQARGLWMEWESNRKQRGFVESVRADEAEASAAREAFLERVEQHRKLIVEAGESIGRRLSAKGAPSDTSIMTAATDYLDRHAGPADYGSGHAALLLWRHHSGVAHSLPWVDLGRVEVLEELEGGGIKGRVTASHTDIGMAVASAVLMTNEALKLYDKLATAPTSRRK